MKETLRRFYRRALDKLARRQGFTLVRIRDADSVVASATMFRAWLDVSGWMRDGTEPRHAKKTVDRCSSGLHLAAHKLTHPSRFN